MIGERLGAYRLEAEIGSGATGSVYRATGPAGTVAVKVIHRHLLGLPGYLERFLREAELGRSVVHPNVVRTLGHGAAGPDRFLVMEYVEGQTLRGLLEELTRVPEELCRHIGQEVARGLAAIHAAGAIHHDVRPANVLITRDHAVKIMDFGVARLAAEVPPPTRPGNFAGSVHYASPEQFGGGPEALDGRADLYSLGVILYELSCGVHPHRGDRVETVLYRVLREEPRRLGDRNPQVSAFLEEVVHALLSRDRERRFPSAEALAGVLEQGEGSAWWQARERQIRKTTRRPPRRVRIPRETAMYGREAELAELRKLFETVRGGDGRAVIVEGEAGVGKTRLLDEFVTRLGEDGEDFQVLSGSYSPDETLPVTGAWSTAYREYFGAEGLAETLKGYLPDMPSLAPAVAAALKGESLPGGPEPLTRDGFRAAIVDITRSLAAERPTVVVIEDLQFAPEAGRTLFAILSLAMPGHRILLVGTTRTEMPELGSIEFSMLPGARRMVLPRLAPEALTDLLADALRSRPLAEALSPRIAEKSDGNPFFVFEMLRGLREERRILRREDGTWVPAGEIGDLETPSSVLDLVKERIAAIDDVDRKLLDAASCCGFSFDPTLAAEAAGLPRVDALKRLGQIERRHRLIRSTGRTCEFDHHLVQEALYECLPAPLRERCHAAVAEALAARHPEPAGAVAVDLCDHLLRAGRGAQARPHLAAALDHLERSYRSVPLVALAERALAAPGLVAGAARADLLLRLAAPNGPLDRLGLLDRQTTAGREALALTREAGDRRGELRATEVLGATLFAAGRFAEAEQHGEQWLAGTREVGDRSGEARAGVFLGKVLLILGRYAEARELCTRSLSIAREVGDRREEARARSGLGAADMRLGLYEDALAHVREALTLFRECGDRRAETAAIRSLGIVYCQIGRHDEGRLHFERALLAAREIGDRKGEANAAGGLGNVLCAAGRHSEAKAQYERWLGISREIGDRLGESNASGNVGVVLWSLGRFAEAQEHFQKNLAIAREIGDRRGEATAAANLAHLLLLLGRRGEVREHLDHALALARMTGDRKVEAYSLAGLGALADAEEDTENARLRHEEALAMRRTLGDGESVADSLLERSEIARRRGEFAAATADLEEARALAREAGSPTLSVLVTARLAGLPEVRPAEALAALEEHQALLGLHQRMRARYFLYEATGDRAQLDEAKRLLDELVAHAPADCRESMVARVRLHREIAAAANSSGDRIARAGDHAS